MLRAEVLGEALLEPVDGVDHERLEVVIDGRELLDRACDALPGGGLVEADHVEVVRAALRIQEDGFRQAGREGGFAYAFGAVEDRLLRAADRSLAQGQRRVCRFRFHVICG